jgi:S-adenosylmethionine uptake transporter
LRFRSQSEDPIVVAFFANTLPALYVLPVFFLLDVQPTTELFAGYVLSAFFGVSFWSLTTIAYARAPAARLAPITYTQLIWAALIGFFLFGEFPGPSTWTGAAVIVGACIYVMRSNSSSTIKATQ